MIQIVIDIPKHVYEHAIERSEDSNDEWDAMRAIANGTPLPEGHRRLIILSEDAVKREQTPLSFSCQNWISEVGLSDATVAIIEADKAESEG